MQIPWGVYFVSADYGVTSVLVGNAFVSSANPHPYTTAPRIASQVKGTGPGFDIVTWHFDNLPQTAVGTIKLTVKCFAGYADNAVRDHSLYVSANNAAQAVLAPNPIGTWVRGKAFDTSRWDAIQRFCDNLGMDVNKTTVAALQNIVDKLSGTSQIHAVGGLDALQLTNGVNIFQLGKDQVLCIGSEIVASGGGNIVASGGGNIVASGGGNIVASGGGNAISISNAPSFDQNGNYTGLGTQTAAYLLNHVANIVASGGGNIVASGGGNLIGQDGAGLISNHPGGAASLLPPSGPGGSIVASGGGNIVASGGGNIVASGGGNVVSQGGGNVVSQGGGNILAVSEGHIVASGGGNIVASGGGNIVTQTRIDGP